MVQGDKYARMSGNATIRPTLTACPPLAGECNRPLTTVDFRFARYSGVARIDSRKAIRQYQFPLGNQASAEVGSITT